MYITRSEYIEDTWDEFGVEHRWKNAERLDVLTTNRGTFLEMIYRPNWGIACYMDNAIQSCEVDESIYHESLVHPVMSSGPVHHVMIIGGGEGATAREVLKWPIKDLNMYEWDKGVVDIFKKKYPQWAKGAWNDDRLTLYHYDIFKMITVTPLQQYDVIIIDLFDPDESNLPQWSMLLYHIKKWLAPRGRIAIYSGIRNVLVKKQGYEVLHDIISVELPELEVTPYKVFVPSFSGESTFLLLAPPTAEQHFTIPSHLTSPIWESYKVFNW